MKLLRIYGHQFYTTNVQCLNVKNNRKFLNPFVFAPDVITSDGDVIRGISHSSFMCTAHIINTKVHRAYDDIIRKTFHEKYNVTLGSDDMIYIPPIEFMVSEFTPKKCHTFLMRQGMLYNFVLTKESNLTLFGNYNPNSLLPLDAIYTKNDPVLLKYENEPLCSYNSDLIITSFPTFEFKKASPFDVTLFAQFQRRFTLAVQNRAFVRAALGNTATILLAVSQYKQFRPNVDEYSKFLYANTCAYDIHYNCLINLITATSQLSTEFLKDRKTFHPFLSYGRRKE